MADIKRYIVALKEGVDYNQFWDEIESGTSGLMYIPDRPVGVANPRWGFTRMCEYLLTDVEARILKNDPRVLAVDQPVEDLPFVSVGPAYSQNDVFVRPKGTDPFEWGASPYVNWGLPLHSNSTDVYNSTGTATSPYNYTLDGTGVDVIISDSGIQADHPEFLDANGNSRVYNPGWDSIAAATGAAGTVGWDAASYVTGDTAINSGHGTHVGGIVAGKTFGWAKNARILSLISVGRTPGGALDILSLMLYWHKNKGSNRPTVINMSWIFYITDSSLNQLTNGSHRGKLWTATDPLQLAQSFKNSKGLIANNGNNFPFSIPAYDTAVSQLTDAGIIICHAAGNNSFKKDIEAGIDYGNYVQGFSLGPATYYYHRGSSPTHSSVIEVGAIDSDKEQTRNLYQAATYSVKGPGVDIWAVGSGTISAWPKNATDIPGFDYFKRPGQGWRQLSSGGTSMASPQIAGICALYLQANPTATPAQVKAWLLANATSTLSNAGTDSDYTNDRSLLGGAPKVAYQNIQDISRIKDANGNWKTIKKIYANNNGSWREVKTTYKNVNGTWTPMTPPVNL